MAKKKKDPKNSPLKTIFEHLDRLLISGGVMAGGGAIFKFSKVLLPSFPEVALFSGLIVALAGLGMACVATVDGAKSIGGIFDDKLKTVVYGSLYIFLGVTMVVALFFAGRHA